MHDRSAIPQLRKGQARLVLDGLLALFREHQVRLDLGGAQRLEQPRAENGAGRAGDADHDPFHLAALALIRSLSLPLPMWLA